MEIYLIIPGVALLALAIWLTRHSLHNAQATGLPGAQVAIVYNDSGAKEEVEEPLFSAHYGLTGKPDYVLRTRRGLVPVELKPLRQAAQPYESDILQLAAYCLLLEDVWQQTPPYALLRYRDKTFRIEWNATLRQTLLETLAEMRELDAFPAYEDGPMPEPQHDMTSRCRSCGFRYICWQSP